MLTMIFMGILAAVGAVKVATGLGFTLYKTINRISAILLILGAALGIAASLTVIPAAIVTTLMINSGICIAASLFIDIFGRTNWELA